MKKLYFSLCLVLVALTSWAATPVTIDCFDAGIQYYPAYFYSADASEMIPLWHIGLRGRGGEQILVDIVDNEKFGLTHDERLDVTRTYTAEADIVTDWSGVTLPGKTEDLFTQEGSTVQVSYSEDGKITLIVDAVCESGALYHITYTDKCEMVAEEIELDLAAAKITLENNTANSSVRNFQIIAEIPGVMSMMVCVKSNKVEGHYSMEDVISDFSDVTWYDEKGDYSVLRLCDVEMDVTADPMHEGAYDYDIHLVTKVGWGYHAKLHSTPWERPIVPIKDTAVIEANNLRMMDYRAAWGEVLFVASSPDHSLNLYARSNVQGPITEETYTLATIDLEYNYVWYWEGEQEKQAIGFDGEYTYEEKEDGRYLTGWLECNNGVHYILNLKYDRAEITRRVEMEFEDAVIEDQLNQGGFILAAEQDTCTLVLAIFSAQIEGSYTEQNLDWQTAYIIEHRNNGELEYMLQPLDAEIEIAPMAGKVDNYEVTIVMTLQAEMDKSDVVEYTMHMYAELYREEEGMTAVWDDGQTAIKRLENGAVVIVTSDGAMYRLSGARIE